MLQNLFSNKYIIILLFLFVIFNKSNAKDFGKHGNTFEIQEQNLLEYIQTKLQEIDIEQWQQDFQERAKKSINRPTPIKLPYARENRIYYFDPSIVLQRDYRDNRGIVFAKKGTKINPLDSMQLSNNLIFIDGDNKQHIDYAINYYKRNNGKVKIILTNGAIMDLMNNLKVRLYFDQQGLLIEKFRIKNIPAIVSQENKLLRIEEVVLNYD